MRASRILAFARTMRCASVGAGVRNACAISSVVRPQTSRSVSATCASGDSAGWQQVKIRRSRSSSTLSSSAHAAGIDDRDVGLVADLVERIEPRAPAHAVDGLEASGRHQPRARIGGHAVARPLLQRGPEGVVQRFLGDVEVAQQADQRGEHATGVGEIDGIHRLVHWIGRRHGDRSHHLHSVSASSSHPTGSTQRPRNSQISTRWRASFDRRGRREISGSFWVSALNVTCLIFQACRPL